MAGRRFDLVHERAAGVGAAKRVVHVGAVEYGSLGSVIACADVMVVPYTSSPHNEARFPNRVGRPVVTNPTGDLGRLVTRERIGIVAPEAPEAFARDIVDLLRQPHLCCEMGRRARALAETTLSWRAVTSGVVELYEDLTGAIRDSPRSSSSS
jgi:glycosyltransferase involved in cell wall biosynthesis